MQGINKSAILIYTKCIFIVNLYHIRRFFMNKQERKQVYDKAEELWGLIAQYDQAIEEMGELIVAINKYKRKCLYGEYKDNPKIIDDLTEEIADVRMCLEQLSYYVGEDKVDAMLDKKMGKLQEEIEYMEKIKNNKE